MNKGIALTYPQLALAIEKKLLMMRDKYKLNDPRRMDFITLALGYNAVSQLLPNKLCELDLTKIPSNIEGYSNILKQLREVAVTQGQISDILEAYLIVNPDYNF